MKIPKTVYIVIDDDGGVVYANSSKDDCKKFIAEWGFTMVQIVKYSHPHKKEKNASPDSRLD